MSQEKFKTSIGGQAVIEGIMMRGPKISALAVRTPKEDIHVETWDNPRPRWYHKVPFVRGIFNMVSSLIVGYKALMRSAEIAGEDEDMQPSKFEIWAAEKLGADVMDVIAVVAVVMAAVLAILLFAVLPTFLTGLLAEQLGTGVLRSLVEGVMKIGIFILYLALMSIVPDIRRIFQYHGAEHKTIACYEAEQELTVENVRPMTRLHRRCGTSFLLIVLVISILVFSVVHVDQIWLRILLKIVLIPVTVGISYEIIRFAGRHDNWLTRGISAPGLWLQRLTTQEPDDSQIQVAIEALLLVIPEEKGADVW